MTGSTSSSAYTPNTKSPLFLLSSDVPGVSLVPVPFSGSGFGGWKRSMIVSLSARNKRAFIDGSCPKPAATFPDYKLGPLYGSVNGTKVFELKREHASTYHGSLDIASYFTKLKRIWDELGVMCSSHANSCKCAAKEGLQKEKEEDKVHQFLMGLNEVYVGVRSNLLMMQPLPSLDNVYNILFQDENPGPLTLFRKYCKKHGHIIDKCYKLHGFPTNFKFTKSRKAAANMVTDSEFSASDCTSSNQTSIVHVAENASVVPGLTKQQYSQLLSLLQQSHVSDPVPQFNIMSSANFAGTLLPKNVVYSFNSTLLNQSDSLTWLVDSGASDHMTANKEYLINITPLPIPFPVSLPNGYKVKVTCTGSFVLTESIILHNVLYLPSFKHNLISVHKLTDQFDRIVQFTRHSCLIQGPSLKKPLDLGKLDSGLYKFVWEKPSQPQATVSNACNSLSSSFVSDHLPCAVNTVFPSCNKVAMNKMDIVCHNRLAHVPFIKMKSISEISSHISSAQSFPCTICPMARQTRLPFPDSSIHSSKPFQLVHVDTWGPYHTSTYSGSKYFLTIVDDLSRCTWTHLMGSKSNAFPLLKAFVLMVQTQFHVTIQSIRSDNALKLGNSNVAVSFFSENGIIHQTSCPHTPQQNGVVERKHRTLLKASRALLFQSKVPIRLWGDCLLTATYIINRLPSRLLQNKSPYELLFGKTPSYSHLRTFGRLCFATVPIPQRDKLKPRVIPCVFLGYPFAKKGYKLYNLQSKQYFVSRDVIFHKQLFPFSSDFSLPIVSKSPLSTTSSSVLTCWFEPDMPPDATTPSSPLSIFFPFDAPSYPNTTDNYHSPSVNLPSPSDASPSSHITDALFESVASTSSPATSVAPLKKSARTHTHPSYLKDYLYKLPSFLSCSAIQPVEFEPYTYSQTPQVPHMIAALHLLRYLKGTPNLGLFYSTSTDFSIKAYSDSNWDACPDTRKFVSGFCIFLGDSLVGWKSKKQHVISLSSTEAQYRAVSKAVAELVWLSRLLHDLTIDVSFPISIFCDNMAAIHIAKNPVFHERTKHIEVTVTSSGAS
ncbi:PREDICTED: uncharacterized protein LOC109239589 [Nicotiana attenuata]|uniref:uncharacterized protein LOC109239589 n=1 Tax=Nicotiana attenuata TaxID=49451 RepID=UPI0009057914|nr:PREDICTED: uncharacterized protein LOC109239589 [Nicotiana attenuata]